MTEPHVTIAPELLAKLTAGAPERYELELPSGRKATVLKKANGRHIERASRMAGDGAGAMRLSMSMVAVKAQVDGKDLTLEDVLELEDHDVFALIGAVMGKAPVSSSVT